MKEVTYGFVEACMLIERTITFNLYLPHLRLFYCCLHLLDGVPSWNKHELKPISSRTLLTYKHTMLFEIKE